MFKNLTGQRFEKLIVLKSTEKRSPNRCVIWQCLCDCGHFVEVAANNLQNKHTQSCGCLHKEKKTLFLNGAFNPMYNCRGADHPAWKGGVSSDRDLIKSTLKYKTWRKQVFKRDNYTCQKCKDNKGGNLNAHHIESFNNNPELRTKVKNGITFCEGCHREFHHQYGFGNNTSEQLSRFLIYRGAKR